MWYIEKTGKLKPIRFFIIDTKNEITAHVASTQLGLLKMLCHTSTTQHRCLDAIKKHATKILMPKALVKFDIHLMAQTYQAPRRSFRSDQQNLASLDKKHFKYRSGGENPIDSA